MQPRNIEEDLQWYEIRDLFVGSSYALASVTQDVKLALELATHCQHPEARWLTEVFAGRGVNHVEEALAVLEEKNDARSLCFVARLSSPVDLVWLRRSAELGYAFAQAIMAEETSEDEGFAWASRAAVQGERDGYYWLGRCFIDARGCEKDEKKAKESFLKAANLK